MLFSVFFCTTPALSMAGTEVADIGSQQPASNYDSEPAKPSPADHDDDDC